jgi:hypothetical protein
MPRTTRTPVAQSNTWLIQKEGPWRTSHQFTDQSSPLRPRHQSIYGYGDRRRYSTGWAIYFPARRTNPVIQAFLAFVSRSSIFTSYLFLFRAELPLELCCVPLSVSLDRRISANPSIGRIWVRSSCAATLINSFCILSFNFNCSYSSFCFERFSNIDTYEETIFFIY